MAERQRHLKRDFIISAFGIGALLSQAHPVLGRELPQIKPVVLHTAEPLSRYNQLQPDCENFPGRNTTFFAKGECPIEVEGIVVLPYFRPRTRIGYWAMVLLEKNTDSKGNPILTGNEPPIIWVRGYTNELGVPKLEFGQKILMRAILADYPEWSALVPSILIPLEIKKLSAGKELPQVPPVNVTHYSYLLNLKEGLVTQYTVLAGNTTENPLTVFVAGSFDCRANVIANSPTSEINRDNCSVSGIFNVDPSSSAMLQYSVSGNGGAFHAFVNSERGSIATEDVLPAPLQ